VLAVEWSNLGYAGAFAFGLIVGVVLTTRLSKVLADFFRAERNGKQ
jgi:hypothetical protein